MNIWCQDEAKVISNREIYKSYDIIRIERNAWVKEIVYVKSERMKEIEQNV